MLADWYTLLFQADPPVVKAGSGSATKAKPKRGRFEVDSFSNWPAKEQKKDDDDCFILLRF